MHHRVLYVEIDVNHSITAIKTDQLQGKYLKKGKHYRTCLRCNAVQGSFFMNLTQISSMEMTDNKEEKPPWNCKVYETSQARLR